MGHGMSVEGRVISLVRDQLGVVEDRITPDLNILGEFDSPDHVEMIMELEEFDITIPDEDAQKLETVAQLIRYVESHERSAEGPRRHGEMPSATSDLLWDRDLEGHIS